MPDALSPGEIWLQKQQELKRRVDDTVERVNRHLRIYEPYPAGHWDVFKIVSHDIAETVAIKFRSKGWVVTYNYDTDAYANYFHIKPPEK